MSTVTVRPSGHSFPCEGKQTILEAALGASIALDYGCSSGTCGLCRARLLQGDIARVKHHDFAFTQAETLNGSFLLCSYAAAGTDVVIEAVEAGGSTDIPLQRIDARVKKLSRVNDRVGVITVQTPRTNRLRFLAGQSARLQFSDGTFTDLPIASCPCEDRNIEFHIRRDPSDAFSNALFNTDNFPISVQIIGPHGRDFGRSESGPTVCLAFDTFIAPVRSWIEQRLTDDARHQVHLRWYGEEKTDFYLDNLFCSWQDAFDAFSYVTVPVVRAQAQSVEVPPPGSPTDTRYLIAGPEWFAQSILDQMAAPEFANCEFVTYSTAGSANGQAD